MSEQYYLRPRNGAADLFIATTSGSSPKPNYIGSLAATIGDLARAGIEVDWLLHQGDCHVDDARNACVAKFLTSGAKKLLFIDDDVGWYAEQLVKFVKHDRDVVAALYPQKRDDPTYPVRLLPPPFQAEPDGLLQVEAVPTGFLLLSRAAVEKMASQAEQMIHDNEPMPLIFERGILDGRRWSGDFWFSRKWTESGGTIWIDPEMSLTHCGQKTWEGCFGDYLRNHNGIIDPYLDKAFRKLQEGVVRPEVFELIADRGGNAPWSAPALMLAKCFEMAKAANGLVLETGSGLTTIVMGMAGAEVHSLEHDLSWFRKTRKLVERYGLKNVNLHYAPLQEHPTGAVWYGLPDEFPHYFDLVVCDGPPRADSDRRALWAMVDISKSDWIVDDVDDVSFYEQGGRKAELIERFAVIRRIGEPA